METTPYLPKTGGEGGGEGCVPVAQLNIGPWSLGPKMKTWGWEALFWGLFVVTVHLHLGQEGAMITHIGQIESAKIFHWKTSDELVEDCLALAKLAFAPLRAILFSYLLFLLAQQKNSLIKSPVKSFMLLNVSHKSSASAARGVISNCPNIYSHGSVEHVECWWNATAINLFVFPWKTLDQWFLTLL